jgi:hypothetical protein
LDLLPYDVLVKGFGILAAAILVVIGVGIGLVGGLQAGTVTGNFALIGGPFIGRGTVVTRVPGAVIFVNIASGRTFVASTNSHLVYAVTMPPGTYRITWRTGHGLHARAPSNGPRGYHLSRELLCPNHMSTLRRQKGRRCAVRNGAHSLW